MGKLYKLVVNVPLTHADILREAIGDAGAGQIGNYSHCSFSIRGIGRFLPNEKAHPYIGEPNQPQSVEEEQIQVDVPSEKLKTVMDAIKSVHPYEEVGFEIYEQVDWEQL